MQLNNRATVGQIILISLTLCGCTHEPDKASLSVTCNGRLALAGASSIDVISPPNTGITTLKFPDPANPGQTATIAVKPEQPCDIDPVMTKTS